MYLFLLVLIENGSTKKAIRNENQLRATTDYMTKSYSPYHPLLAILKFIAKKKKIVRFHFSVTFLIQSLCLITHDHMPQKRTRIKMKKFTPFTLCFVSKSPSVESISRQFFFSGYHKRRRCQFHLLLYFAGASKINSSIRRTSCRKTSVLKGSTREWRTFI